MTNKNPILTRDDIIKELQLINAKIDAMIDDSYRFYTPKQEKELDLLLANRREYLKMLEKLIKTY